eukprot:1722247-Pleurochrysis_carterae.AAC.2
MELVIFSHRICGAGGLAVEFQLSRNDVGALQDPVYPLSDSGLWKQLLVQAMEDTNTSWPNASHPLQVTSDTRKHLSRFARNKGLLAGDLVGLILGPRYTFTACLGSAAGSASTVGPLIDQLQESGRLQQLLQYESLPPLQSQPPPSAPRPESPTRSFVDAEVGQPPSTPPLPTPVSDGTVEVILKAITEGSKDGLCQVRICVYNCGCCVAAVLKLLTAVVIVAQARTAFLDFVGIELFDFLFLAMGLVAVAAVVAWALYLKQGSSLAILSPPSATISHSVVAGACAFLRYR